MANEKDKDELILRNPWTTTENLIASKLNNDNSNVLETNTSGFQYGAYDNKYDGMVKAAYDKVANFNYDPTTDASYQAYARQYKQLGEDAYNNALGVQAAKNGGIGSTYAGAVANQSYNDYMQQLASKVPELEQIAYDRARSNLSDTMSMADYDYNNWKNQQDIAYNNYQLANTTTDYSLSDYQDVIDNIKSFGTTEEQENYIFGLIDNGVIPESVGTNIYYRYIASGNNTNQENTSVGKVEKELESLVSNGNTNSTAAITYITRKVKSGEITKEEANYLAEKYSIKNGIGDQWYYTE